LSDATLQAALAVETTTPALSRATAARREWDVFPGTFSVEVESAGDVDVDDHSGREYNIGIEPTVDPQDGPGEKAVILSDTAFEDVSGAIDYAFYFVLDDRPGWRAMADEVAANLASGAAETSEPAGPTSEPCAMYSAEDVAAMIGAEASEVVAQHDTRRRSCDWSVGNGSLNLTFYDSADIGSSYLFLDDGAGAILFRVSPASGDGQRNLAVGYVITQNLNSRIID
jgi:hypothetical protein